MSARPPNDGVSGQPPPALCDMPVQDLRPQGVVCMGVRVASAANCTAPADGVDEGCHVRTNRQGQRLRRVGEIVGSGSRIGDRASFDLKLPMKAPGKHIDRPAVGIVAGVGNKLIV
jgi:hypothetical protein